MLINLEADKVTGVFTMPYMSFKNEYVAVTELLIKFSQPTQVHGFVKTTLVDLNIFNPKQIIFTFSQEQVSSYIHCKPTQHQAYKIQLTDLQLAEFKIEISPIEKIKNIKIEEVFLQIKIINAGIQQGS